MAVNASIYLLGEILLIESFVHTRSVVLTCRWRVAEVTRKVLRGGTTRAAQACCD